MYINVSKDDRRLMPKLIIVLGGENSDELSELRQTTINAYVTYLLRNKFK